VRYGQRDIQVFKNKDIRFSDIHRSDTLRIYGEGFRHDDYRMGFFSSIDRWKDQFKYIQANERKYIIMKNILMTVVLFCLVSGSAFAGNPAIKAGNTGGQVASSYESMCMEVRNQSIPAATPLVWYTDNIAGYSSIDFYGMAVSSGNAPTTISAQAIFSNGASIGAEQIITSGTDLTDIRSPHYKFTLPAFSVTRNVTFNFLIAD
jgi:hypothetical protein